MTLKADDIAASIELTLPAYDVEHAAETIWETGFEHGAHTPAGEGFTTTAPASASGYSLNSRTDSYAGLLLVKVPGTPAGTSIAVFTKSLSGLVPGRMYVVSMWVTGPSTSDNYTDRVRIGIAGKGDSAYLTLSTAWQLVSYPFVASNPVHTLVITGDETDAAATSSSFLIDDLTLVKSAWTEHFSATTQDVDLAVKEADLTIDDGWAPFVQGRLNCYLLQEQLLEFLDPRQELRVVVVITTTAGTGLTLDLALRSRTVDHNAGTMTLTVASDERMLMDRARVATTADTSYLAYQASLRALVNQVLTSELGTVLEADAGADADLTIFSDSTNLIRNPSAETDTTTWGAVQITLTRLASGVTGVVGANRFRLQTPTVDNNCYAYTDVTVEPGETYVYSGNWIINGTTSGSANLLARRLAVSTTAGPVFAYSPAAVTSGERVYGEVTIPAGVTTVRLRAYHGYTTSGDIGWDAIKFAVKTGSTSDHTYFDGTTTDTASYNYAWTGTTNLSTSTRTDLTAKGITEDLFTWNPGVTPWDFVYPLVEAAGLRLFCDDNRDWHLVDPATWTVAGTITISEGVNATVAQDTIDRAGDEWFDSVVVKYAWLNKYGIPKVRYDVAGAGGKTLLVEYDRPYPGAGAAAARLLRAAGRGRVIDLEAISDYAAMPAKGLAISLPSTPAQAGKISAVTWRFPDGTMTIKSRDLA